MRPTCDRNLPEAIAAFLYEGHLGEDRAIHAEPLGSLFGVTARTVGVAVNSAVKAGHLIGSGDDGYYYVSSEAEWEKAFGLLLARYNDLGERMGRMLERKPDLQRPRLMMVARG